MSKEILCDPPPDHIIYFYGEYQDMLKELTNVEFKRGLPHEIKFDSRPTWIIIDDLMYESSNSKFIAELFTKGSHHRNVSLMLINQNFFVRGSEMRSISLNSQYIVLFKNPRDQLIATSLARQMFPNKIKKFQKIYEDATSRSYSYLFIDLKSGTPNEVRLLTNIFSLPIIAYQLV